MKQIILSLSLFFIYGTTPFTINLTANEGSSFNLQLENPGKLRLPLQISHRSFGLVVDTVISQATYTCRYNLQDADDGKYTLTIGTGKEKQTREIDLHTTVITRRYITVQ